jgi:hypothetical protein
VGIGASPTAGKLLIDANPLMASPAIALHINNSFGGAGNNAAITFGGTGSSAGAYGFIDYNPNSSNGIRYSALGPLVFGTNTNSGYGASTFTESMRITSSGNIGINTASPSSRVHLYENNNGNNSANGITIEQAGTGNALLQFLQTSVQRWTVGIDNASSQSFKIATGAGLGTADRFTILNTGNIGIGTTSPGAQLEIAKTIRVLSGTQVLPTTGKGIEFNYNSATDRGEIYAYDRDGNVSKTIRINSTLMINSSGNVGIGSLNPDQKLTVNGMVHATAAIVDNSIPADYVFNYNYYLRPLTEVKAFVYKNHHLPEVPSAAEIKKDGQNLGDMNMTLLKKVEELTLYMIAQDKKTAELTAMLKKQQQEITRLKKRKK